MGNLQKPTLGNSKRAEETPELNEDLIKIHNDESDDGYFLEVDVQHRKKFP